MVLPPAEEIILEILSGSEYGMTFGEVVAKAGRIFNPISRATVARALKKLTSKGDVKKEVIKTTVIGKAMIEESQLETKKRALLKDLVELTFDLYKHGKIQNKDVEAFCRKINIVINRIDEKQSSIDSHNRIHL